MLQRIYIDVFFETSMTFGILIVLNEHVWIGKRVVHQ